jgi:hypothetical protein
MKGRMMHGNHPGMEFHASNDDDDDDDAALQQLSPEICWLHSKTEKESRHQQGQLS